MTRPARKAKSGRDEIAKFRVGEVTYSIRRQGGWFSLVIGHPSVTQSIRLSREDALFLVREQIIDPKLRTLVSACFRGEFGVSVTLGRYGRRAARRAR